MSEMVRFTVWMSEAERLRIQKIADDNGASANFVVRTLIRAGLGFSASRINLQPDLPKQPKREHA